MKVFLASSHEGLTVKNREALIEKGRPRYLLETFFNGEKKCRETLGNVGVDNFLLDSGAFSYMSGAECTKKTLWEYAEKYAEFIVRHNVKNYFELDVDTIFGIDFVEDIRKMLESKTNRPSMPVWHKGRGVEYFKKMVSDYDYIAIGGLVFHVKQSEWPAIKKMVDYAYNNRTKVHGLGFTKTKLLHDWKFYSVDSASWNKAAALGQQIFTFTGNDMTHHRIDKQGKKVKLSELILHNGIEWCKYQRYMDTKGF